MNTRRSKTVASTFAVIGALGAMMHSSLAAAPTADAIATDKIKDLTATLNVIDSETKFDELKKIGGAFATTYRFKKMDAAYKNPNKVRFESRIAGASVLIVFNGDTKMFKVPFRKQVQNIAGQPGQKQSLMDMGIFAKDYLSANYEPIFLRAEGGLQVYKLVQRGTTNKSHEIVWVNPKTAVTERRQSFNGEDKMQKELRYKNPVEIRPGIFVPTRIEVYNQFGKLGAVQSVNNIKVNLGVADSLFSTS